MLCLQLSICGNGAWPASSSAGQNAAATVLWRHRSADSSIRSNDRYLQCREAMIFAGVVNALRQLMRIDAALQ
jgi:hypothetical protein